MKNEKQEYEKNYNFINDLDDIEKLKRLFLIYTANDKKLHSQKFLKLLNDASLLDKDFDSKYADILFFAGSKSKTHIDFSNFCEIVLKISEIKFPLDFIKNQTDALNRLFRNYLFPLLKKIYSNSNKNFGPSSSGLSYSKGLQSHTDYTKLILNINSNNDFKEVLDKHLYLIIKIYQKYFPWESINISEDKRINLSEKSFVRFCKDFEIQPNLISLIKLNDIYTNSTLNTKLILSVVNSVMDNNIPNQGSYYTLFHFIICLYLISIQGILSVNQNFQSNHEYHDEMKKSNTPKNNYKGNEIDYKIDDIVNGEDLSK